LRSYTSVCKDEDEDECCQGLIPQPCIMAAIMAVIVAEFDKEWMSELNIRLCCEAFDGLERFTYIPDRVKSEKDGG
jgi:hypothetical protein